MDPTKASYQFSDRSEIIQLSVWQSLPPATAGERLLPIGLQDQHVAAIEPAIRESRRHES
jgi:hypothetical protein